MKGIEKEQLFGLFMLLAFLLVVFAIVIIPLIASGKWFPGQIDFRQFCLFWSRNNYREGLDEKVNINGNEIPVNDACKSGLGLMRELNADDIENCRNLCRSK